MACLEKQQQQQQNTKTKNKTKRKANIKPHTHQVNISFEEGMALAKNSFFEKKNKIK